MGMGETDRTCQLDNRFWSKVEKGPNCWLWKATRNNQGYGQYWDSRRKKLVLSHRASWEMAEGNDIPKGLCVLHRCDTPACVRPSHLKLGTQADNLKDMASKGRSASGNRNGLRIHPESAPRGIRNGQSKLTWEEVKRAREIRINDGWPLRKLAVEFQVSLSTMYDIISEKSWKPEWV